MSKTDITEIAQIAKLAKLTLSAEEIEKYSETLGIVINHFTEINAVKTEGVEPLVTPIEMTMLAREDEVMKLITTEEAVAGAKDKQGNLFKVPPVV